MRGYFAVDIRDKEHVGQVTDYHILFKSPGTIDSADLADSLKDGLRRTLFPDAVVIVCVPKETELILEVLKKNPDAQQALARASSKVCVAICAIDKSGVLTSPKYVRNPRQSLPLIESKLQGNIYEEGLKALFSVKNVLVEAPAGFTFVKPSQDRSTFFLRAEEALFETDRVNFLAYALLERIAKREESAKGPIEIIFIDTMAIASLAYIMRELYSELFGHPPPRVVSFHSYGGIEDVPRPRAGTSLCLISASSSMNMHRKWLNLTHCLPSEVITLLTLKSAKESQLAIHAFDRDDLQGGQGQPTGLRDLRIVGERFSPEDTPLKQVLLTVRAHKNERWFDIGPQYSKEGLFTPMKASCPQDKVRPIFVDGLRLLEHDGFKKYIEKEMCQRVPISVRAVVYQDDATSAELAKRCATLIKKITRKSKAPPIINAKKIAEERDSIKDNDALLIVAAVIGRGTQMLSISRDLRDIHFGARHYMIGFQVSESITDCVQLKKNLNFSAKKSAIGVSIMESVAVGRTVGDAYRDEITTLNQWNHIQDSPSLTKRMEELHNRVGITQGPFLPPTVPGQEKLMLRKDFAYWRDGYSQELDHSTAVLMTAATMLQQARESKEFKNDDHRLASDTFQQVVLDPENFARYNDGVIQAALLRAAHPSELDYSSHEDASRRMREFLTGVFSLYEREQGEAALEFALALRNKRMKLSEPDMAYLREQAKESLQGNGEFHELLKDLLGIGAANAWSDEPSI